MISCTTFTPFLSHLNTCRIHIVIVLALFLGACSTATNLKTSPLSAANDAKNEQLQAPKKILVMPLDVELSLLTAAGLSEPKAEWTEKAISHITEILKSALQQGGDTIQFYERSENSADSDQVQLEKLHQATGFSILMHDMGQLPLPSRAADKNPSAWSLGPKAKLLAEETGADYALFTFVRDSYSSGGRKALMAIASLLGGGIQGGTQVGFGSLVDLSSGEIVWFNRLMSATGDLREKEAAELSVSYLLQNFPSNQ